MATAWKDGVGTHTAKNGAVSWRIRYRVPVERNSKVTKQVKETLPNCRTRRQAETVLALRQSEAFKQEWKPKSARAPETVRSFAETFLEAKRNLASVKTYALAMRLHLVPFFGDKVLDEIMVGDCTDYRLMRRDEGASPAYIRNELRCLQSLMSEARSRNLCERDPVASVRFDDVDNARGRVLTDAEVGKLIVAARSFENYVRPFFFTLYVTGARLGEVVRLPWSAVDFEAGFIRMHNKGKGAGRRKQPVMNKLLREELLLWKTSAPKSEWVFPSRNDHKKHRSAGAVRAYWDKLLERAEVTNLRRHDMRHNLVTRLDKMGATHKETMSQSGHATLTMLNRYSHAEADAVRELLEQLPDGRGLTVASETSNPDTVVHIQTHSRKRT